MTRRASSTSSGDARPWWKDAVVYQIYPRSFADANGDGVGDLLGVRERLPYLAWLGVDAIWLSPFYRSPMHDAGYDVSDYLDVDPIFGTLADFDALLADAHDLGLRVLVDWVPNHTSSEHPWFVESRSSRDSPKRGWYVWRDGRPGGAPPNNWRAVFGGRAWDWDEATQQWYLHLFLPEQPDLDWSNPEVVSAMHDVLRFWLDRGVDGFRIDVAHMIGKDPLLPDEPPDLADVHIVGRHDYEGTHELFRGIRRVVDEYGGDRMLVGEITLRDTFRLARYHGEGDELHLVFNFLTLDARWEAREWATLIDVVLNELSPHAWPTWFLSNHDNPRHRTRYGGSEEIARAAAVLLLTLCGTPFLYQGEELGLEDAAVTEDERIDPAGRDGCRAPMPWTSDAPYGWNARPLLPFAPEAAPRSVEAQQADPASILHLYRDLLRLRRASPALRGGDLMLLDAPEDVVAFERSFAGETKLVVVNFGSRGVEVPALAPKRVEVSSAGRRDERAHSGMLAPFEAVVAE